MLQPDPVDAGLFDLCEDAEIAGFAVGVELLPATPSGPSCRCCWPTSSSTATSCTRPAPRAPTASS